jgi:hypothetical protein
MRALYEPGRLCSMSDDDFEFDNPELADSVTHANVAKESMKTGDAIDDLADRYLDAFGDQTDEEDEDADAAATKARALAKEHGEGYHGFGNPPDKQDG